MRSFLGSVDRRRRRDGATSTPIASTRSHARTPSTVAPLRNGTPDSEVEYMDLSFEPPGHDHGGARSSHAATNHHSLPSRSRSSALTAKLARTFSFVRTHTPTPGVQEISAPITTSVTRRGVAISEFGTPVAAIDSDHGGGGPLSPIGNWGEIIRIIDVDNSLSEEGDSSGTFGHGLRAHHVSCHSVASPVSTVGPTASRFGGGGCGNNPPSSFDARARTLPAQHHNVWHRRQATYIPHSPSLPCDFERSIHSTLFEESSPARSHSRHHSLPASDVFASPPLRHGQWQAPQFHSSTPTHTAAVPSSPSRYSGPSSARGGRFSPAFTFSPLLTRAVESPVAPAPHIRSPLSATFGPLSEQRAPARPPPRQHTPSPPSHLRHRSNTAQSQFRIPRKPVPAVVPEEGSVDGSYQGHGGSSNSNPFRVPPFPPLPPLPTSPFSAATLPTSPTHRRHSTLSVAVSTSGDVSLSRELDCLFDELLDECRSSPTQHRRSQSLSTTLDMARQRNREREKAQGPLESYGLARRGAVHKKPSRGALVSSRSQPVGLSSYRLGETCTPKSTGADFKSSTDEGHNHAGRPSLGPRNHAAAADLRPFFPSGRSFEPVRAPRPSITLVCAPAAGAGGAIAKPPGSPSGKRVRTAVRDFERRNSPARPSFHESDSENENENPDSTECGGSPTKTLPDRHTRHNQHQSEATTPAPAPASSPARNPHHQHQWHTPASKSHTQTPTSRSLGHRAHKSVASATSTPIRALASILGKHPGVDSDELTLESKRMMEAARLRRQQRAARGGD